jgi:superfamily II DNA or RNA helicase
VIEIEKYNNVYLKINCEKEIQYELKEFFSCYAPSYRFHPKFKAKIWNGKVSVYDYKSSLLPIGLLIDLLEFCKQFNYKFKIDIKKIGIFDETITKDKLNIFHKDLFRDVDIFPRDYQTDAIKTILYKKRCVIESATGSGKSLIIYSVIRYLLKLNKQTILIVPSVSLVEQMISDFKSYGWDDVNDHVSILYSGKEVDNGKGVLISTWQSVFGKPEEFFNRFEGLIIDEVQSLGKSVSVQNISKMCINADYRIGTTGTLPEDKLDRFNIFGYLGPKEFETKASELIDGGVLSKILIVNFLCKYPMDMILENKKRKYAEEIRTITSYPKRNKVFNSIFNVIDKGSNTLILCQFIDHLKAIEKYLIENLDDKYKIATIYGDVSPTKRELLRASIENEENFVLIGTYATMSTGINIKKIHNIVLASSYKSKIKILQSIGRGLRKHDTKSKLYLFDIVDDLTWKKRTGTVGKNHVYLQFEERLKYYKDQNFKFVHKKIEL